MSKRIGALVALAAAFAMTLLTVVNPANPANAITHDPIPQLIVHKYTTPAGAEGTGVATEVPEANKPVQGVEYTVYQVKNIDMSTNAGWQQAAQLQKRFKENPSLDTVGSANYTKVGTQTTDATGAAAFSFGVGKRGLYVVVESNISGARVDGKAVTVVGAKPFIVAVPMTNPTDTSRWLWTVSVNPKNAVVSASKQVQDENTYTAGSTVKFPVTTDIPAASGSKLEKYVVVDKFDTAHLTYTGVALNAGEQSFSETTDYTVENNAGLVKVRFTAAGLSKLEGLRGQHLTTVFSAKVKAVGNSNGQFTNTAYLVPSNDYNEDPDNPTAGGKLPPIPSNPVSEHFTKIVVHKLGEGGAKLAGAKFSLVLCESSGSPLSVNGNRVFTTDAQGQLTIDGVRVADFYNGKKQSEPQAHYCLIERQAPTGYELLPEPVKLDVTTANVHNGVYTIDVHNTKHNAGFHLPLTGSSAAIALVAVGMLLVAGGAVVLLRRRHQG